jgi:hypothetical protein
MIENLAVHEAIPREMAGTYMRPFSVDSVPAALSEEVASFILLSVRGTRLLFGGPTARRGLRDQSLAAAQRR